MITELKIRFALDECQVTHQSLHEVKINYKVEKNKKIWFFMTCKEDKTAQFDSENGDRFSPGEEI